MLHTPTYATHPMSTRPDKQQAQQGLSCRCAVGSFSGASCHLQISYFKILHGNQMKSPLVIKHISWVDDH